MDAGTRVLMLSIGGVAGVNARYWLGLWMGRWAAAHWATFAINVSGSFAIGFLSMALARWLPHPNIRLMVLTGFLGGYTTFSTFGFESVTLWERGERGTSLSYMVGSLLAGFLAAWLGIALARDLLIPAWDRRPAEAGAPRATTVGPLAEDPRLAIEDAGSPDLELPPGAEGLIPGLEEGRDGA